MTDAEKIELLKNVLKENGLDFNDPIINDFFTEERKKSEVMVMLDESVGAKVRYSHSQLIAPAFKKVTPIEIDNASYSEVHDLNTILDWFLYKNSGDNPLVFENIGKDSEPLINSYLETAKHFTLKEDLDGNLFNYGDGNHRLLTLIINNFIELLKAKTDEEISAVENKYGMVVPVSLPHKQDLCDALMDEYKIIPDYWTKDEERRFPRAVCAYREETFKKAKANDYLVDYNPETKKYSYEFNLDKFVGTDDELIGWLTFKEKSKEPVMKWNINGMYYLSCNNSVLKSKNKNEIERKAEAVIKNLENHKAQKNNFVTVKNLDDNTYEFQYSKEIENDFDVNLEAAEFWDLVLKGRPEKVLFNKLKYSEFCEKVLRKNVHDTKYLNMGFSMCDFKYENLTHDEFLKIERLFETFEQRLEAVKNKAKEL